jgi:hypothetical protein
VEILDFLKGHGRAIGKRAETSKVNVNVLSLNINYSIIQRNDEKLNYQDTWS